MSATPPSTTSNGDPPPPTFNDIMNKAAASALRGGIAGAAAMGANVACLMWMRTTVRKTMYRKNEGMLCFVVCSCVVWHC